LTATRLHELLVGEGHRVGVTVVKDAVAERKRQRREVFVPLTYRPGDLAQVDFFEVLVGRRRDAPRGLAVPDARCIRAAISRGSMSARIKSAFSMGSRCLPAVHRTDSASNACTRRRPRPTLAAAEARPPISVWGRLIHVFADGDPRQPQLAGDRPLRPPLNQYFVSNDMHEIHPEHPPANPGSPDPASPQSGPQVVYFPSGVWSTF